MYITKTGQNKLLGLDAVDNVGYGEFYNVLYGKALIVVGEGKYGAYIRYDGKFTSLPKTLDPYTITLEQALGLIQQKKQAELPLHVFGDIQVLNGKYGAYIKTPQGNYRLSRSIDVQALTEQQCLDIISSSAPAGKSRRKYQKG